MLEEVILVNELDQEIGLEEKITAHRKALLHRAFSVFIFRKSNDKIELLLQKRHQDKYHCAGLWTNSVCSHPRPNETLENAALRRLHEELGIHVPLKKAGHFIYKAAFANGLTEHEFDHVFVGFNPQEKLQIDPQEIAAVAWISLPELQLNLTQHPERYTPWLAPALEIAIKLCNQSD